MSTSINNLGITFPDNTTQTTAATLPLGVGQAWTNVSSSRAMSTLYTNTTGRPIFVLFVNGGSGNSASYNVQVGGATISGGVFVNWSGNSEQFPVSFIVPDGKTYQIQSINTGVSISVWSELR